MPVICHAQPRLAYKLGAVGRFNADIFILRLVDFFVGVANRHICAGLNRAHRNRTLYMGPLCFNLLFKFQAFFGLTRIRIRRCFHPQLTAGRQTVFRLLQFFRCPFRFPPGFGELCIFCLWWEFVSGKFQLGRPFWLSFGCLRWFLLWFLGFCRLLETLLVFVAVLVHPGTAICLDGFSLRGVPYIRIAAVRILTPGIHISEIPPARFRCRSSRFQRVPCFRCPCRLMVHIPAFQMFRYGNIRLPRYIRFERLCIIRCLLCCGFIPPAPGRSQRRRGIPDPQQVKILFALPGVHPFLRMGITDRHPGIFLFPLKFFFPRHCYHLQSFLFSGIYAPATSSGRVVSTLYNRVSFGK